MRLITALALLAALAGPGFSQEGEQVRLMVGFRPGVEIERRENIVGRMGMSVVEDLDPLNVLVVETSQQGFHLNSVQLQSHPQVARVERDVYIKWTRSAPASFAQTEFAVNVAEFKGKFSPKKGLQPVEQIPWGVEAVKAPAAWNPKDLRSMGAGVKVAVLDTGVDCSHPDLHCTYGDGVNILTAKRTDPIDDNGHGTHVAGTIAAQRNGIGVVGVAPAVKIVPVKVLDKDAMGWMSNVIRGITWCANQEPPIPVINISLASAHNSIFLHSAVMFAKNRNVTMIAASGNDGGNNASEAFPAAYKEVIAVAAMDVDHTLASFSSRGSRVFVAPGVDVVSTTIDLAPATPAERYTYGRDFGSSMAVPHVAGLAAIAVAYGALGADEVRDRLAAASRPIRGKTSEIGFGLPDATKLIPPLPALRSTSPARKLK